MSLFSSLAIGALAILGIGGAVAYFGPKLWAQAKEAVSSAAKGLWSSLTGGAQAVLAAPGEALGYLKESAAYDRDPDRDRKAIDPTTGKPWLSPFNYGGKSPGEAQREAAAEAAKKRATEAKPETISRLKAQKALLEATGQPYIVDIEAGGQRVTLEEVNAQLSALGAS